MAEAADDDIVGPMPPAEGVAEEDQPRKKPRKTLAHEKLYLQKLPSCQMYERSFMHRDTITHLVFTATEFLVTASADGHLKFWKKFKVGLEFVKHFRAHLGTIEGLAADADGLLLATTSNDKSLKVYDVINFDMINMLKLPFTPTVCEWIHKKGAANALVACGEEGVGNIHIYAGRGDPVPLHTITIHSAQVTSLKYIPALHFVLSADIKGMIEYWSADEEEKFGFPKNLAFEYKSDTDLYEFAKNKAYVHQLSISPTYQHFAATSSDRKIRIFELLTGKLYRVYDESVDFYNQRQQEHQLMPAMEFGRRIAAEREMQKSLAIRRENAVFDETGYFILYPSLVGVKVVNIRSNTCVRVIGKGENIRLLHLALFQPQSQKTMLTIQGIDNPNMQSDEPDPTLFCTSYKKNRFYLFTNREPEDTGGDVSRDTFNEKPTREEQMTAAGAAAEPQLADSAIIHTTMGDITVKLHPKEAPKAVENFVGLSRKNYYNGCIFHRVIKNFMVQTGDPRGDGSGGESIWGYEFEDEFHPSLRHDRPYVLSMANAGRNTNGSQFFITVVPTPWLDNKHTIFGIVTKGMEVAQAISVVKTDPKSDKPYDDIKIISVTVK